MVLAGYRNCSRETRSWWRMKVFGRPYKIGGAGDIIIAAKPALHNRSGFMFETTISNV